MTKEEAIKYLQQLYPNGGHCWLDEQRIEAISMAIKALQESGDLEKDLDTYIQDNFTIDKEQLDRFGVEPKDYLYSMTKDDMLKMVRNFTYWQKQQIMKDAVEGLVICDELTHGYKDIVFAIPDVLKVGDKVKLIIIKEE